MPNNLVKILVNEDGDEEDREWCATVNADGCVRTVCRGEVFGFGEGNAQYIEKTTVRGGITCPTCLETIAQYRAIKL